MRRFWWVILCLVLLFASLFALWQFALYPAYIDYTHPTDYAREVEKAAEAHGVPREIIFAVIKNESGFDPKAVSHAGAMGLMQMMPSTYRDLLSKRGMEEKDPETLFDPAESIDFGTYYLARLYKRFGDWDATFAAYNAGQGNVKKWLSDPDYAENGKLKTIPIEETRKYVKRVNLSVEIYREKLDALSK